MICLLCEEPIGDTEFTDPIGTPEGPRLAHRICMLRDVIGGIGHLIAHPYWCDERNDPDAGLSRYQSARLVQTWVEVVGTPAEVVGTPAEELN
jgi:hypothetical protein